MKKKFTILLFILYVYGYANNMDLRDDYISHKLQNKQEIQVMPLKKDNTKDNETIAYKYKINYIHECPKDVAILMLDDECEECGRFEVSVRKHSSCCSGKKCSNIKDEK